MEWLPFDDWHPITDVPQEDISEVNILLARKELGIWVFSVASSGEINHFAKFWQYWKYIEPPKEE